MLMRRQRWMRRGLLTLLGVLGLIAALPWLVSVESFRPDIEQQLSAAIQHEVKIASLSLRTLPRLQLVADEITIDSTRLDSRVQIGQLSIVPDFFALLGGDIEIHQLGLRDVRLNRPFIDAMIALGKQHQGSTPSPGIDVRIDRIDIKQLRFALDPATELGPYHLRAQLDANLRPVSLRIDREDGHASLVLSAAGEGFNLVLHGRDWRPPVGPALLFKDIDARGLLTADALDIASLNANAYSGSVQGKTRIAWQKGWSVTGRLDGKHLDSEQLLGVFLAQPVIAGRFDGGFDFALRGTTAAQLGKQPSVKGDFAFHDGVIYNADLEKATSLLNTGATKGGQTPFSEMSGHLAMQDGMIRLEQLQIRSDVLEATGKLRIDSQRQLAGVVDVGVTRTGSLVSVPLKIAGSMDEPTLRPTDSAMAGGAVGTGLLGPGVGTAVGVKVGSFFSNLFGSEDDDAETKPAGQSPPADD